MNEASTLLTLDGSFLQENISSLSELFPTSSPRLLFKLSLALVREPSLKKTIQSRLDELKDVPIFKNELLFDVDKRNIL